MGIYRFTVYETKDLTYRPMTRSKTGKLGNYCQEASQNSILLFTT
jgi:hypothetical protein